MPKPKLTAAEKAAEKARIAALKARQAQYKRTAKLIKAKDPVKRAEGMRDCPISPLCRRVTFDA